MLNNSLPVNLIILSDRYDNRKKMKYLKMFYIEAEGYVVASQDDNSYNLFKIINKDGKPPELHDINEDTEWKMVDNYLRTHHLNVIEK